MKNIKKKTKVFIETLVIISTFFIGSVLGSEVLLVFKGTNTIDKAKELIQDLTERNNTITDEYNKLDSNATEKIESLENNINSLKVDIQTLTDERNKLQTQYDELSKTEPYSTIVSLKQKIESLENEIKSKESELKRKDELLQEKDDQLESKDSKITQLENELTKANDKCNELQEVIDNVELKEFKKSELVED